MTDWNQKSDDKREKQLDSYWFLCMSKIRKTNCFKAKAQLKKQEE